MKRHTLNYVDNALRDIKRGINNLESLSRTESLDNFILRLREIKREFEVMEEVVTSIEDQLALEV